MEKVNTMTDDITSATNEQDASTRQIHQAIAQINDMASQIQQATTQQLTGVHQLLETTNNVTRLIDRNLKVPNRLPTPLENSHRKLIFWCIRLIGLDWRDKKVYPP
jgi:ABC-type transporter Mla subunit MlaD